MERVFPPRIASYVLSVVNYECHRAVYPSFLLFLPFPPQTSMSVRTTRAGPTSSVSTRRAASPVSRGCSVSAATGPRRMAPYVSVSEEGRRGDGMGWDGMGREERGGERRGGEERRGGDESGGGYGTSGTALYCVSVSGEGVQGASTFSKETLESLTASKHPAHMLNLCGLYQ